MNCKVTCFSHSISDESESSWHYNLLLVNIYSTIINKAKIIWQYVLLLMEDLMTESIIHKSKHKGEPQSKTELGVK